MTWNTTWMPANIVAWNMVWSCDDTYQPPSLFMASGVVLILVFICIMFGCCLFFDYVELKLHKELSAQLESMKGEIRAVERQLGGKLTAFNETTRELRDQLEAEPASYASYFTEPNFTGVESVLYSPQHVRLATLYKNAQGEMVRTWQLRGSLQLQPNAICSIYSDKVRGMRMISSQDTESLLKDSGHQRKQSPGSTWIMDVNEIFTSFMEEVSNIEGECSVFLLMAPRAVKSFSSHPEKTKAPHWAGTGDGEKDAAAG